MLKKPSINLGSMRLYTNKTLQLLFAYISHTICIFFACITKTVRFSISIHIRNAAWHTRACNVHFVNITVRRTYKSTYCQHTYPNLNNINDHFARIAAFNSMGLFFTSAHIEYRLYYLWERASRQRRYSGVGCISGCIGCTKAGMKCNLGKYSVTFPFELWWKACC